MKKGFLIVSCLILPVNPAFASDNPSESTGILITILFFAAFVLVIMACFEMSKIAANGTGDWGAVITKFIVAALFAGLVGIIHILKYSVTDDDGYESLKYNTLKFSSDDSEKKQEDTIEKETVKGLKGDSP